MRLVSPILGSVWLGLFTKSCNCLKFIYVGGGVGPSRSTCLQNDIRRVEPDVKIVKTGFLFFCSIFDQNTLLKISQMKTKCSSGKKWVLKS